MAVDSRRNDIRYKPQYTYLIHMGLWAALFLFPLLFSDNFNFWFTLYRHWVPLTIAGLIFYFNYFFLIPRFFFVKRRVHFIIANICVVIIGIGMLYAFKENFRPRIMAEAETFLFSDEGNGKRKFPPRLRRLPGSRVEPLYAGAFTFLLAIGAAVGAKVTRKWAYLEHEHLKSEVASLKFQLQPHFFFNTLNNIYSLIDTNTEQAKETVHKLAKLMRYVLYKANEQYVSLREEINFIKAYADVMRVRYGDHVSFQIDIPENVGGTVVPPLIFISPIENAFKHGIDSKKDSYINIKISVDDKWATLEVRNSSYPKTYDDESGSGIGMENLQQRLSLLYLPDQYRYLYGEDQGEYRVVLSILTSHG